jgi:hypothetical protein
LAFGPDSNGTFGSPVEPPADALRVREWTEAHGWQDLGPPPRPTPGQVFSADVTCGPGAAAYLPVQSPPAGLGRDLRWYDDAAGTWPAVPALTPQGYPGVVRVASLRGVRVLVTDAHVFTLDPGAPAWAVHPSIPGHRLLANGRYLVTTDNDDGVRLRVVDVASLSPT